MFEGATTLTGGENLLRSGRTERAMRGEVKKNRNSDGGRELGGHKMGERGGFLKTCCLARRRWEGVGGVAGV